MLIFNTTYKVPNALSMHWIDWMKTNHIPFMLINNTFEKPQIVKIVGSEDEQGVSYAVQFQILDMEMLTKWHQQNATKFQQSFVHEFGNDIQFFSTVLEIIE